MAPTNKLKKLRERARMTQQMLADRVGLTHSAVSLHESHKRGISTKHAALYCSVFGVGSLFDA